MCQIFYTKVHLPKWRVSLDCVQMCKVLSSKFTSCWKKCRKGFTACNVEASSKCKYLVFVAFYFAKKSPNVYIAFVPIQCQSFFFFFTVKMVKKILFCWFRYLHSHCFLRNIWHSDYMMEWRQRRQRCHWHIGCHYWRIGRHYWPIRCYWR